jgi:hypothetical protein
MIASIAGRGNTRAGPINGTRQLRRSLRDIRDRAARKDWRWQRVSFAGFAGSGSAMVLARHEKINRTELSTIPERRWPDVRVTGPIYVHPSSELTDLTPRACPAESAFEPMRIVVMPQASAWDEPMAMVFAGGSG